MKFVAGIDVGGKKKGFHVAILEESSLKIHSLFQAQEATKVKEDIKRLGECRAIAIDCPPKAIIKGPETRLVERELCKLGYRVQWTRRSPMKPQEWMVNGESLWRALKEWECIETFPTVTSDHLNGVRHTLPIQLLSGRGKRKQDKDYLDACLCAITAQRYLQGESHAIGVGDELGPIFY